MASVQPVRRRSGRDSLEGKQLLSGLDEDDDEEPKSKLDQWLQFALTKLTALLWIVLAIGIALYTELWELVINGHPPKDPSRQLNRYAQQLWKHGHAPCSLSNRRAAPCAMQLLVQHRPGWLWRLVPGCPLPHRLA